MTDEQQDEQFYRDTESIAFPKLNDHQLSLLEPLGERRMMKRGDVLFKAGQRDLGLAIVLRGEFEAFDLAAQHNCQSEIELSGFKKYVAAFHHPAFGQRLK